MKKIKILLLCSPLLLLLACVDLIELPNDDPRVVIEGFITNKGAGVKVTSSISKTADNEFPPIASADVKLEGENGNELLLIKVNEGEYASPIPANAGERFKLQVSNEGKTYTAFSTMPESIIEMDSLQHRIGSLIPDSPAVSIVRMFVQDPAGEVNRGLFQIYVNNERIQDRLYNDDGKDGTYLTEEVFLDTLLPLGTEVKVELFQFELQLFDYFLALERAQNQEALGGLTVAPPINPKGNFDNDALGVFAAATVTEKIIIVE